LLHAILAYGLPPQTGISPSRAAPGECRGRSGRREDRWRP
jgi:hypothetical protein